MILLNNSIIWKLVCAMFYALYSPTLQTFAPVKLSQTCLQTAVGCGSYTTREQSVNMFEMFTE